MHNGLLGCHGGHLVFGCVKTRPIAKELRPMPGPPQKLALCPSFSLFLGHMSPAYIVNSECFQHTFHPSNISSDYFLCIFSRVTPTDQKEKKKRHITALNVVNITADFVGIPWEHIAIRHLKHCLSEAVAL